MYVLRDVIDNAPLDELKPVIFEWNVSSKIYRPAVDPTVFGISYMNVEKTEENEEIKRILRETIPKFFFEIETILDWTTEPRKESNSE